MPMMRPRARGIFFVAMWALVAAVGTRAADNLVGANRAAVVDYYGKPSSSMRSSSKEVLIYPDGRVTLVNDQVTQNTVPFPKFDSAPKTAGGAKASSGKPASVSAERLGELAAPPRKKNAVPDDDVPSTQGVGVWHWPLGIFTTISLASLVVRAIMRHRDRMPSADRMSLARREVAVGTAVGRAASAVEAAPRTLVAPDLHRALPVDRDSTPPPFPVAPSVIAMEFSPLATPAPLTVSVTAIRLTPALMCELEWRRFEEIAAGYYRAIGARPELTRAGANGGLDLRLYRVGENRPYAFVQCKAWVDRDIDEGILESTLRIMHADGIGSGVVITPRAFTETAREFAAGKPLELIDGPVFINLFNALPDTEQQSILREATRGDFRTPTCPQCGQKMVQRDAPDGREWYCTGFPQCHAKPLKVRTPAPVAVSLSRVSAA